MQDVATPCEGEITRQPTSLPISHPSQNPRTYPIKLPTTNWGQFSCTQLISLPAVDTHTPAKEGW